MKVSSLIIPVSIVAHLLIINLTLWCLTPETYLNFGSIIYYNLSWLLIAYGLNYYPTRRKERFVTRLDKLLQQYLIFGLAYFALFGFRRVENFSPEYQIEVFVVICVFLTIYRWFFYKLREEYRLEGGNFVNVVVIGRDRNLKKIRQVFDQPDLGYRYKGYFSNWSSKSPTYLGKMVDFWDYIKSNQVDEIYCMASQLSQDELKNLITFADNNMKKLKIIPDNKEIFTRGMTIELYETIPVINLRKLPLDTSSAKIGKRIFDLVFSSLVIVFLLSWLIPLLGILLKIESRGPVFFKQLRHGYNKKPFWCYKFRSMAVNSEANTKMSTKNDSRVTKLGKILRKTSIDELPQFINVFLGNMSVVGPRPHMEAHTLQYENSVDKYLVRHFVKPGVTGLAQIKGYRGEIVKEADIINRTRMDIFYLEKWSVFLDLEIIYCTVKNAIRGEEKAY